MAELLKRIDMATPSLSGFTGLQGTKNASGGYNFGPNVGKNVADWTSPLSQAVPSGRSIYDPQRREEWLLRQERMAMRGGMFPNMGGGGRGGYGGAMTPPQPRPTGVRDLKVNQVQVGPGAGAPGTMRVQLQGQPSDPNQWSTINPRQYSQSSTGRLYLMPGQSLQRAATQALFG